MPQDLDAQHLRRLREAMFSGARKHVFVSDSVRRLMQSSGHFPELASKASPVSNQILPVLQRGENCAIHQHLHFSNYGKFETRLQEEGRAIRALVAA